MVAPRATWTKVLSDFLADVEIVEHDLSLPEALAQVREIVAKYTRSGAARDGLTMELQMLVGDAVRGRQLRTQPANNGADTP